MSIADTDVTFRDWTRYADDEPNTEVDPLCFLLEALRREKCRLVEQLEQSSRTSARLATLWAAVERIHASTDRARICEAVEDIVLNLIGGEQCAIFEVDRGGAHLNLVSSVGLDADSMREVGFGEGLIGRVAASGRMFVKSDERLNDGALWDETLSACIPLKYCGRLTGVIAILGMQLQKAEFAPIDLEMFQLLSKHAAMAFHAAADASPRKRRQKE